MSDGDAATAGVPLSDGWSAIPSSSYELIVSDYSPAFEPDPADIGKKGRKGKGDQEGQGSGKDKGTGTGAHDLQNNTINLIRGERADADAAGDDSNFTADIKASERAAFNAAWPNRFAFKHAHSQQNPEKDWGRNVLRSIKFAFDVLNDKFRPHFHFTKHNTIVIASSVSNGAIFPILLRRRRRSPLAKWITMKHPRSTCCHSWRKMLTSRSRSLIRWARRDGFVLTICIPPLTTRKRARRCCGW